MTKKHFPMTTETNVGLEIKDISSKHLDLNRRKNIMNVRSYNSGFEALSSILPEIW